MVAFPCLDGMGHVPPTLAPGYPFLTATQTHGLQDAPYFPTRMREHYTDDLCPVSTVS